jgi:predicted transcriptional regulator
MCGTRLSPEKVAYLLLLLNEKQWNVTEIANKLNISRSSMCHYKNYVNLISKEGKYRHIKEAGLES